MFPFRASGPFLLPFSRLVVLFAVVVRSVVPARDPPSKRPLLGAGPSPKFGYRAHVGMCTGSLPSACQENGEVNLLMISACLVGVDFLFNQNLPTRTDPTVQGTPQGCWPPGTWSPLPNIRGANDTSTAQQGWFKRKHGE